MGIWLNGENLYPPRLGKEKSHTFQRVATELLPRGITCRAQQLAIHQMPEPPGSEKYGFMSEIKRCWFVLLGERADNERHAAAQKTRNFKRESGCFQMKLSPPTTFPTFSSTALTDNLMLLWMALRCLSSRTRSPFVLPNTPCHLFSFGSLAAHLSSPRGADKIYFHWAQGI